MIAPSEKCVGGPPSLPVTRCAFVSNLNETSEVPDLRPGQEAMRSALEADLVMNVFRDGRWGSFRHQLFTNGNQTITDSLSRVGEGVVHRGGNPRDVPDCSVSDVNEESTEHAYVNVLTRGDLSSLRWISSPLRHFSSSDPNVVLCRVSYSSLNFRDIMLATGKLPPDAIPGTVGGVTLIL